MSSPFRHFRKHSKTFFAVASVLAIGLFVFGSGTGAGRNANNPSGRNASAVVATWNGGSINEGQLEQLIYQRLITNQFLKMLFVAGGGQSLYYDMPAGVPWQSILLQSEDNSYVQQEVVYTELFASLGAEAGITVSDAMVNAYLTEFGLQRVGNDQTRAILANVGKGDVKNNEKVVLSTIRKLLTAYYYRQSFGDSSAVVLPAEKWDDWRAVNERISLQAASLPIEGFLDQVPQPTEEQLRKLYDEFKDAEPNLIFDVGGRELPSPNPGFAEPRRVKLQYLVGTVADRTKKLLDTVTQEEIADYYERNKRKEFVKSGLGDDAASFDNETSDGGTPEGETPKSESPAGEPTTTEASPGESPTTETPAAEPATEGDAPTADSTPAEEAPADEPPAPAEGDGKQSSVVPRRSPFRLTALQSAPAADAKADAPADQSAAPADTTTIPPAATPPAETTPEAAETTPLGSGAAAPDETAADAKAEEPEPEYEPLDKVSDVIRETLARDKAVQELQSSMDQAVAKLQSEYNRYGRDLVAAREAKKKEPKAPAKLKNIDWLAAETGLVAETTAPLTIRELSETPVGKAADEQTGRISVTGAAFYSLKPYEPFLAHELEGDWYLVAKVEDTPKRVPEFDEVRDQVAAAWKRIEAAKLAEKKAKELAAEADASTEPFHTFFKGKGIETKNTELFSRRQYAVSPGLGNPPELGNVPELKNVGPEFLEAAFALDGEKSVAVLNFDHSVAYVIRLNSRQYTTEELKKLFLEEVTSWPGYQDMREERRRMFEQAVNDRILKDVAGFKFDPDWAAEQQKRAASRE
jgi:hypothetical protein